MSKLGAVFLAGAVLLASPTAATIAAAAEAPHQIGRAAAWGCRDQRDVFDLLFLALSTSFDSELTQALAEGRCVYFKPGEDVTILDDNGSRGLVKVRRGGAAPAAYWTPLRNVD